MALTRNDFPNLADELESIFNEVSATKIAEMDAVKTLFEIKDEDHYQHEHLILHGLDGFTETTPGAQFPIRNSTEGDSITWSQRYLSGRVLVTKEMRRFDRFNQMEALVRSMTASSWDKINQSLADILLNGFATTAYTDVLGGSITPTGPDSLALFSAAHTNNLNSTTFRNIIRNDGGVNDPVLTRAAVVRARRDALVHSDPQGVIRPVNLDTLVVSPGNEDLAYRIADSEGMSGTANNDRNPLKGRLKVVVWPHLETRGSDSTDTSGYWFMADSGKVKETLKLLFAQKPTLNPPTTVSDTQDWEWTIDGFLVYGFGYAPYLRGSRGLV